MQIQESENKTERKYTCIQTPRLQDTVTDIGVSTIQLIQKVMQKGLTLLLAIF